jgi:hypothetical protein
MLIVYASLAYFTNWGLYCIVVPEGILTSCMVQLATLTSY